MALVPRIRQDKLSGQTGHPPTPSAQDFARVTSQFNENLYALSHVCPDDNYRVRVG